MKARQIERLFFGAKERRCLKHTDVNTGEIEWVCSESIKGIFPVYVLAGRIYTAKDKYGWLWISTIHWKTCLKGIADWRIDTNKSEIERLCWSGEHLHSCDDIQKVPMTRRLQACAARASINWQHFTAKMTGMALANKHTGTSLHPNIVNSFVYMPKYCKQI